MKMLDSIPRPSTPEDMHHLLDIEAFVKTIDGFTHFGIDGYVVTVYQRFERDAAIREFPAIKQLFEGGDNGPVKRRVPSTDRTAA